MNILRSLCLSALALAMTFSPAAAEDISFTLLLVNDIDRMEGIKGRGGFDRVSGVVAAERAKGGNVLFIHAGDTLSPSLMSGFDHGKHVIDLLNVTPPDVFVPGNHEFDFGPDTFKERMTEAKFPLFAANLRGPDDQPLPGFSDTKIFEFGSLKLGMVGLAADDSAVKSRPGDLKFLPTVETGTAKAADLRAAGADLVLAVAHASQDKDRALVDSRAFDIILSGDDHDLTLFFDGKTVLAESKEQGEFVTAIDVEVSIEERDGKRRVSWWPNFRLIDTASIEPLAEAAEKTAAYQQSLSSELDVVIGRTATPLDSRNVTVRGGEAAIGNLIADAMRETLGGDIAITNGGGIRGNTEYPAASELTRRHIMTELPFGNHTVLLEASGDTIWAALENGFSQIENGAGRFPQVSGMKVVVDLTQPAGNRVASVKIKGEELDRSRQYKLATNDFMAEGGDGYVVLKDAKRLLEARYASLLAVDVMNYIQQAKEVAPKVEGRILLQP